MSQPVKLCADFEQDGTGSSPGRLTTEQTDKLASGSASHGREAPAAPVAGFPRHHPSMNGLGQFSIATMNTNTVIKLLQEPGHRGGCNGHER